MTFSRPDSSRETQVIDKNPPSTGQGGSLLSVLGNSEHRRKAREKAAGKSAMLFTGLFLILIAMIGIFTAYQKASEWVDHTYQVLNVVERLSSSLTEAESAQRGYLLTREDSYLKPYLDGKGRVEPLLEQARLLTADNPTQQDNLRILHDLANAKLDELALTMKQADSGTPDQVFEIVQEGTGQRLMAQIRTMINSMSALEEDLLLMRESRERLLGFLMVAFTIAFAVGAFWSVQSTFRRLNSDYESERMEGAALSDALRRNAMLLDRSITGSRTPFRSSPIYCERRQ